MSTFASLLFPGRPMPQVAAFVLRVSLGVVMLAHGFLMKILGWGWAGTIEGFAGMGFPAFVAVYVMLAESIGGLLLVLGLGTRVVNLVLIPLLIGATTVHWGNGWGFSSQGGGWEYPVFLIVATVVSALLGSGAFALDNLLAPKTMLQKVMGK